MFYIKLYVAFGGPWWMDTTLLWSVYVCMYVQYHLCFLNRKIVCCPDLALVLPLPNLFNGQKHSSLHSLRIVLGVYALLLHSESCFPYFLLQFKLMPSWNECVQKIFLQSLLGSGRMLCNSCTLLLVEAFFILAAVGVAYFKEESLQKVLQQKRVGFSSVKIHHHRSTSGTDRAKKTM